MDFANIDEKTAFRAGFVSRCYEEGLSVKEAAARLEFFEKRSAGPLLAALPWIASGLAGLGTGIYAGTKAVAETAVPAAKFLFGVPVAAGLLGGAAGGYGLAKATEPDIDEDDIKAQELAQTYKVYSDRMKARNAYQQYRKAQSQKQSPGQV